MLKKEEQIITKIAATYGVDEGLVNKLILVGLLLVIGATFWFIFIAKPAAPEDVPLTEDQILSEELWKESNL